MLWRSHHAEGAAHPYREDPYFLDVVSKKRATSKKNEKHLIISGGHEDRHGPVIHEVARYAANGKIVVGSGAVYAVGGSVALRWVLAAVVSVHLLLHLVEPALLALRHGAGLPGDQVERVSPGQHVHLEAVNR